MRRGGFLVLTGIPRPVLGESFTTSIKDFAIFPPHQKKKKKTKKTKKIHNITKRKPILTCIAKNKKAPDCIDSKADNGVS